MAKKNSDPALVKYWAGLDRKAKSGLAEELDTSVGYLRQVFFYGRQPGAVRAKALSEQTGLAACHFRPDIFPGEPGQPDLLSA